MRHPVLNLHFLNLNFCMFWTCMFWTCRFWTWIFAFSELACFELEIDSTNLRPVFNFEPGADVMIFKIFSPKNWRFWLKTKLNYVFKNFIITLVFEKNANFFRQKLSKIAENCDHNIVPRGRNFAPRSEDPRVECVHPWGWAMGLNVHTYRWRIHPSSKNWPQTHLYRYLVNS
jgi:hypothetical protein